ncbi:uncharacterized protein ACO6RY_03651 [Pungitius sinensis]
MANGVKYWSSYEPR